MRISHRAVGQQRYHSTVHLSTHSHGVGDPFAENPIRRSLTVVVIAGAVLGVAALAGGAVAGLIMLSVGWLAITALIFGLPVLVWSLVDEGVAALNRRLSPAIDTLDLSPRIVSILRRYGYEAIAQVARADDASLLEMSNLGQAGLHELRRAISLWRYRRWQEAGFPAGREYE